MGNGKAHDHAVARFTIPMNTDALKVTGARTSIAAIKNSTNYNLATDVQSATIAWDKETDNLDAGLKSVSDLEKKLEAARADLQATLRRWGFRRQGVLGAINVYCDGSKDKVQSFSVEVAEIGAHATPAVPAGLASRRDATPGVAGVQWFKTPENRGGFMVQHCTNPADAATLSTPVWTSKRSFKLPGQIPGATIHFRVLALDDTIPGGQTDWSAWVPATVTA